jgi:hypothetical protein
MSCCKESSKFKHKENCHQTNKVWANPKWLIRNRRRSEKRAKPIRSIILISHPRSCLSKIRFCFLYRHYCWVSQKLDYAFSPAQPQPFYLYLSLSTMTVAAQPPIPPNKGLMREDLLVLRYLLGLGLSHSLQTPTSCRELPNTSIMDVIFLAFDTEAIRKGQLHLVKRFQVGVSILDTRALLDLVSVHSATTLEQQDLLQTRNFCIGPSGYCLKASRRFLFGQSETINSDKIETRIKDMIYNRDVVLVVHSGCQDLWFLKELNIDLQPIAILDTQITYSRKRCKLYFTSSFDDCCKRLARYKS